MKLQRLVLNLVKVQPVVVVAVVIQGLDDVRENLMIKISRRRKDQGMIDPNRVLENEEKWKVRVPQLQVQIQIIDDEEKEMTIDEEEIEIVLRRLEMIPVAIQDDKILVIIRNVMTNDSK